jgi:16S rRNA (adenine1518-N6/adenine1519-N6)-dimethyltransferase
MNLPELNIPHLLHQFKLHPHKSLGQNFLLDESALQKVIDAAQVTLQDVVLEVGAGLGSLTRHLAVKANRVVAVELDSSLIPALNQVVGQYSNVLVVEGDILALNPVQLVSHAPYLVVANIPYYITSALIRHLLESTLPPRRLVLTVQLEVAKRICAIPGEMSLLALSVQVFGIPKIMAHIPPGAFYPPPRVDSAIIRIDLLPTPLIPPTKLELFFVLIKAGFSQKRKTLRNALAGGLHRSPTAVEAMLIDAQIDPMRRAETLSLAEWNSLVEQYLEEN